jgi:glycosyltransferase involved in cell wall biosynthesis
VNAQRRVLVVAPYMCRGDTASGDLRLQRMLELLAQSEAVDLLVPEPQPSRLDPGSRYWNLLRNAGVSIVDSRFHSRVALRCESQTPPYDWIIAEFWHQAAAIAHDVEMVRRDQPGLRFAIDTVDVHYLREQAAVQCAAADYGSASEVEARKRRELATYRLADALLVCTEEDAHSLAAEVPGCRSVVVPNIVVPLARRRAARDKHLIFIGGFRHAPNVDAVLWFVREVFPVVRARLPDVQFSIIGSHASAAIQELHAAPGVRVVGFVEDTSAWLDKAAVSIAPLRYGAGMKGKVTEALSAGIPVVATAVGAQGLGAVSGVHLHIADTAMAFADAVVASLVDPVAAEAMGARGRELVESICGAERVRRDLLDTLSSQPHESAASRGRRGVWNRARALLQCRLWILRCQAARVRNSLRLRLGTLLKRLSRVAARSAQQSP